MLDQEDIEYSIHRSEPWVGEGKYSTRRLEIIIESKYYRFGESRSGDYHTRYCGSLDYVEEFIPDTKYSVNYTFPNKKVAQDFISWMCDEGEQYMWEYADLSKKDLNRDVEYDYEKGTLEIKSEF